jgi:Acetyltransferase (GNAT) domain
VIIETERLTMRPIALDDGPLLQKLLDDPAIAEQIPSVRHPLPPNGGEQWVREAMEDVTFACIQRETGDLGGVVALHLEPGNRAQLGGWCGEAWRHEGYAVEAMHACVRYGYEELGLDTIYALRKGRLWIAPREFADRHLPFRHAPESWHVLDDIGEDGPSRAGSSFRLRLGRFLRRT